MSFSLGCVEMSGNTATNAATNLLGKLTLPKADSVHRNLLSLCSLALLTCFKSSPSSLKWWPGGEQWG